MREVIVDWTIPGNGGGLNVLYFDDNHPVAEQRDALGLALETMEPRLSTLASWVIRTEGRQLDPATGTLIGSWSDFRTIGGQGTGAGTVVSNASQVLLKWGTVAIVDGRLVRGRTYIPGLDPINVFQGNLSQAAQASFQAATATLLAGAGSGLVVWHRPNAKGPGSAHPVSGTSVWSEIAVQRRRRT